MKLFLETPALRFVTKKFADAISDLDAKIADSPVLAPLFGVEKKKVIIAPLFETNPRDIRQFLNKDLIKKSVALSMKYEAARRLRSPLAREAYVETENSLETAQQEFLNARLPIKNLSDLRKLFQPKVV